MTIQELYMKYHDAVDNLLYTEGGLVEEKALFNIVKDIYRQGRIDMYQDLRNHANFSFEDVAKEFDIHWGA